MSASGDSDMLALLGVPADERLLDAELDGLPAEEQSVAVAVSGGAHDHLVRVGSLLTGLTLVGGVALALYGGWRLLDHGGGAPAVVLLAIGVALAATHWGWVHVAEYVGVSLDARSGRAVEARNRRWLGQIEPYPRYSVATDVLPSASIRVRRFLHRPVVTDRGTFTFVREVDAEQVFAADTPTEEIASAVETMRRKARLDSDRLHGQWEAASGAYEAAIASSEDEQHLLAARRAAATALSEHINASLLKPPLVE